jgi:hypothetical protein
VLNERIAYLTLPGELFIMRTIACVCGILVIGSFLLSQEPAPSTKLRIGTPKSSVYAAFGKPFGVFKVVADDSNGAIGVPIGMWTVYHLTTPPDRMYVTIVHYGTRSISDSSSGGVVDALMLMPAGQEKVAQILADQPEFASICKASCELVLATNKAGNRSLLLRPKDLRTDTVLYFDGDSAGRWKSVTSMESIVSWAYVLSKSEFEAHHKSTEDQVIGNWSPETAAGK